MTEHSDSNSFDAPNEMLDFKEDPILNQSLDELKTVSVPHDFLPNVMYRVYEKKARDEISLAKIIGYSVALVAVALSFFVLDVNRYMESKGLDTFYEAFSERSQQTLNTFDSFMTALAGIAQASWQLLLTGTIPPTAAGIFLVLACLAIYWGASSVRD